MRVNIIAKHAALKDLRIRWRLGRFVRRTEQGNTAGHGRRHSAAASDDTVVFCLILVVARHCSLDGHAVWEGLLIRG